MLTLSRLRRFALVDEAGGRAKLDDFIIALTADHPPVTALLFRQAKGELKRLCWESVKRIDRRAKQIDVVCFDAAQRVAPESLAREVLLRRDVQDSLVIDLQNRRVTRANDLWLDESDNGLALRAADVSARAILRRLSRGVFGRKHMSELYDWKYIEFLRGDAQAARTGSSYHLRVARLPPGEIAALSDALPYLHSAELLTLLPDPVAADTLEAMTPARQLQVFEELDEDQGLRLLALMSPDRAADLLGRLETSEMRRFIERLPKLQSDRVIELLRYPDDTVGGIMTNDVAFVPENLTVAEAREWLREGLKEPGFAFLIYVVDGKESRRLRGLISLRNLIVAPDEQRIKEIMDSYVTTLNPLEAAKEAAYRVINSHLAAMPVVGSENQLLGVVTVDAAVSEVAPPSWSAQAPRIFT